MASRKLNDLSDRFRPLAIELIARCIEASIQVIIVDTLRTLEEQKDAVARGVSWTLNSKHLTGDAIDICPLETYQIHGASKLDWDASDPVWQDIGKIGQGLGLKWGVVNHNGERKDLGHFEFVEAQPNAVA